MEYLFNDEGHQNIWFEDAMSGFAVQANQHLIVHNGKAMLLDPGGHKAYKPTFSNVASVVGISDLEIIFLSHQDPDICAAINGWLMTTEADAYCSELWDRFIAHFGVDKYVQDRLKLVPDEGTIFDLNGSKIMIIPAHFLHSVGNFHVYDPISKILYSGDLGASLGADYRFVEDFDAHTRFMEDFHKRYMVSQRAVSAWAQMARQLDIEIIAPQHGAAFKGKEMVARFIDWCASLPCGIDLMESIYKVPE